MKPLIPSLQKLAALAAVLAIPYIAPAAQRMFASLAHGATANGALNVASATWTANNGVVIGGGNASIILNNSTLKLINSGATIGTLASPVAILAATNSALTMPAQNATPTVTAAVLPGGGV